MKKTDGLMVERSHSQKQRSWSEEYLTQLYEETLLKLRIKAELIKIADLYL